MRSSQKIRELDFPVSWPRGRIFRFPEDDSLRHRLMDVILVLSHDAYFSNLIQ